MYSKKVTKFCKIFTLLLSYAVPVKSELKNLRVGKKLKQIQLFWEGKKNLQHLPHGFDVNVNTMRKIAQIFVAFSEKLNFK